MIVENQYLEDIQKIWKENNSGYISEESNNTLLKNNKILKIVYIFRRKYSSADILLYIKEMIFAR